MYKIILSLVLSITLFSVANPVSAQEKKAVVDGSKQAYMEIYRLVSQGKFEEAKTGLSKFQKDYPDSSYARYASKLSRELAVVGKESPQKWAIDKWFIGKDKIDLASTKPTLLVFWEYWCPHCKREVPRVQSLFDKYSSKGFQVVGFTKMTRSVTEETINSFIKENKLSYPIAKESGELSKYFAVSGIPAAAVIKDKKVVWRGHPAKVTEKMIEGWL